MPEEEPVEVAQAGVRESYLSLVRRPFLGTSFALTILGIGVGLVTYGFTQWVPTNLQHLGYSAVNSDYVVRNAALLGLPLTVVVAWMYGVLGSRRTIDRRLRVHRADPDGLRDRRQLAGPREACCSRCCWCSPLAGVSSIVAVVAGYAAEVYPTLIRSRGTGLAAGMTKAGGVLILAVVVASKNVPSISATALIGAIPLLVAAVAFLWAGPETKQRTLEDISVELAVAGQ